MAPRGAALRFGDRRSGRLLFNRRFRSSVPEAGGDLAGCNTARSSPESPRRGAAVHDRIVYFGVRLVLLGILVHRPTALPRVLEVLVAMSVALERAVVRRRVRT